MNERIQIKRQDGRIWSPLRQKWLEETPEERVRQEYLCCLANEYGYSFDQMAEEIEVTGRGSGKARADFVLWRSARDKIDKSNPLIVVECKADTISIKPTDYGQGDNYARLTGARFLVTHNTRETKYWRVLHDRMPKSLEEISGIPHVDSTDSEIEKLIAELKVFKEDEFADLLHQCHNVIRNREKLDPAAAFDEIAKILFVKVYVERELGSKRQKRNLFTVQYLDDQIGKHPLNSLFAQTKEAYEEDKLFGPDEEIRLRSATCREIVKLLERYNLSDTSEDVKGIAFERFLGRTFRGEIGQFFTPRTIVEFMIRLVDPNEGDVICDPAAGSGGFLIRFFEIVREQILENGDKQYNAFKATLDAKAIPDAERARELRARFESIGATVKDRLEQLANKCIFGSDANDRMARTSKMNMIMHGDGHAGVHHHDGFLNVNGIFEERFDIVLTNPPFGASVDQSEIVHATDVYAEKVEEKRYLEEYGKDYASAIERTRRAVNTPLLSMFQLPKGRGQIKTEVLFIERCLDLLRPGGRLGIVLPEGVFNNASLGYVRDFCEDRAFLRAIVSLPADTFLSSGASVKASLLFLQKFTHDEQEEYDKILKSATEEITSGRRGRGESDAVTKQVRDEIRARVKGSFDYPIFIYEAQRVGITATGEEDLNELCRFPRDNPPPGCDATCLELYQQFVKSAGEKRSFKPIPVDELAS